MPHLSSIVLAIQLRELFSYKKSAAFEAIPNISSGVRLLFIPLWLAGLEIGEISSTEHPTMQIDKRIKINACFIMIDLINLIDL